MVNSIKQCIVFLRCASENIPLGHDVIKRFPLARRSRKCGCQTTQAILNTCSLAHLYRAHIGQRSTGSLLLRLTRPKTLFNRLIWNTQHWGWLNLIVSTCLLCSTFVPLGNAPHSRGVEYIGRQYILSCKQPQKILKIHATLLQLSWLATLYQRAV